MATNNNCEGCGCGPSIPEPCITPPPICPDPQPCIEITDAQCVKYTGPALTCNDVPIIPTNTSLADALAALVDLTCEDACCTIPAVSSIDDPDYIMLCVDDTALCPYDGLLYNWFAINAATAGNGRVAGGIVNINALDNPINTWRVPNNNDWQALVTAINPTATFAPWDNIAAGPMKSLTCWSIPNSAASNSTTLAVMPSVYRFDTGVFTPNNGQIGTYWGWDSVATATGYMYSLEFDDNTLFRTIVDKNQGLRLRLVRPAECNEDPGDAIPNAYKDNSGNLYNGIVIGSLVWLTADLKDLKYNNGNVIPLEAVDTAWAALATGALCYPLNDTTYEQVFGNDIECRIANIYTHLEKVIKDKIPTGDFFTGADGIVGYGIINDNIPKQVNFGKNIILLNKLYYKNILSVKDKNLHAVEYLPNVKVSDNFVDIIFSMTKNKQPSKETISTLSTDEQHLLDTLLYISGIKSSSVSNNKDDIIKELKNKLRLAEGQIKAGNDNPVVKEELKDIIKKLYLYNVVSLKNSKEYLKQF